jgi:hypothetical protein
MGAATAPPFPGFGRAAAHLLVQYQECVAIGAWPTLVFETRGGNKYIDFSCSNPPCMGAGQSAPCQRSEERMAKGQEGGLGC